MKIKEKFTLEELKKFFDTLGIRYTMETMRYCAEKDLNLATLTNFSPKNLLDLIMLGTKGIDVEKADELIEKWFSKGYSLPMLHNLAVQEARASGFFITEADTKAMGEMDLEDIDILKTVLPLITQEMSTVVNYTDSMKNVL